MESVIQVKMKGTLRINKLKRKKRYYDYIVTPPKHQMKKFIDYRYNKMETKLGYNYEETHDDQISRSLKWQKEEFEQKMKKYLGKDKVVTRMGRIDKIKMKEELGLQIKKNPLVAKYSRINKIMQNKFKQIAFGRIQNSQ